VRLAWATPGVALAPPAPLLVCAAADATVQRMLKRCDAAAERATRARVRHARDYVSRVEVNGGAPPADIVATTARRATASAPLTRLPLISLSSRSLFVSSPSHRCDVGDDYDYDDDDNDDDAKRWLCGTHLIGLLLNPRTAANTCTACF
jgi:hypothetical protein